MPQKGLLEIVVEALDTGRTPEELCGDDLDLLARVKDRLKKYERISTQIDDLFPAALPPTRRSVVPQTERLPSIPGYDILSVLGRGGIGVVYEARHLRLGRRVALKMLLSGDFATGGEVRRFAREAKSIAALRHPHIVQIFDFGEHDGRPFFTMELLEGGSLGDKLGGRALTPVEAAETVATLAAAVEAAHASGIVHRDLKPANILLTATGVLKVSDFGLAFANEDLSITQIGQPIGTPSYMAPEQAAGTADASKSAVDVYALGTLLYETLTGRPPFLGMTAAETQRRVIHEIPPAPSRLQGGVPRDLDVICGKCLEKQPQQRYASAADLAADLRRFLCHEPIKARPVSWAGQAVRWRRRHPGVAAALSSILALVALMVIGSLVATAYFRAMERQQAQLALDKSRLAVANDVARALAVEGKQKEAELRRQAEDNGQQLRRTLYFAQMNLGNQAAASPSGLGRVIQWIAPWERDTPDLRDWEWYYLNGLCHRDLRTLNGHAGGIYGMAKSPKGDRLVSADAEGTINVWETLSGRLLRTLVGHGVGVRTVAWSPDGAKITSAGMDGTVMIWDAASGDRLNTIIGTPGTATALAWNRLGTQLATAGADPVVCVWDVSTAQRISTLTNVPRGTRVLAWSPDGRCIATGGEDFNIYLWDAATATPLTTLKGHSNFITGLAWNADGTRLASASNDMRVKLWDTKAGVCTQTLIGHASGVNAVAWSDDGQSLLSGGSDHTVRSWSTATGRASGVYRGHTQPVTAVAWGAGGTPVSSSFDATVKVWPTTPTDEAVSLRPDLAGIRSAAWSHDARWIAAADEDYTVSVWNPKTRDRRIVLRGATSDINAIAWGPDDLYVAAAGQDQMVRIWNVETGQVVATLTTGTAIKALAWSLDNRLASGGDDGIVRVWDPATEQEVLTFQGHTDAVRTLGFSPDSTLLASGSTDATIAVWDVKSRTLKSKLVGHTACVNGVAWGGDPHRLASCGDDQSVRLWNVVDGRLLATFLGHTAGVRGVAWRPGDTRLASAGDDHTVKIWDAAGGNVALTLPTDDGNPSTVGFDRDGWRLLVAGDHHLLRVYDATPGRRPDTPATQSSQSTSEPTALIKGNL